MVEWQPAHFCGWCCFHCGAVFTDRDKAEAHFGKPGDYPQQPALCVDSPEYALLRKVSSEAGSLQCSSVLVSSELILEIRKLLSERKP